MTNNKLFSISLKMALIIFIIALVNIFMVPPSSAEFYILLITMFLMIIMIVIGTIMVRRDK